MALKIDKPISSIQIVDTTVHNVERTNSVERRYKALRQDSKAPTFRLNLPGHIYHVNEKLRFLGRESQKSGGTL